MRPRKRRRTISIADNNSPLADAYFDRLLEQDPKLDNTFGIRVGRNSIPMIGDKVITIYADDIIIGDGVYHGSQGLWSLITERRPQHYEKEDMVAYRDNTGSN